MKHERLILADTSAWIASFQSEGYASLKEKLRSALERNLLAITGIILCELLQGAKNQTEYESLRARLSALPYLPTPEEFWERAGKLSFALRRKGIVVPTPDVVIAQMALDNQCSVLHCDKHFDLIARHTELIVSSPN